MLGAIVRNNRAIEINPKNASAFYNRGAIESELGDRQASASDYDRSVLLNPQYAEKNYTQTSVIYYSPVIYNPYYIGGYYRSGVVVYYNQGIFFNFNPFYSNPI